MEIIKNDIQHRKDIKKLVFTFYEKVKQDETLGPIFNTIITNWDDHIERLTDFWETNLLFVTKFKGNPIKVHNQVDQFCKNQITNIHFGIWLRLWINTIDQLYAGDLATLAKNRARKMGTTLFIRMFQNRAS